MKAESLLSRRLCYNVICRAAAPPGGNASDKSRALAGTFGPSEDSPPRALQTANPQDHRRDNLGACARAENGSCAALRQLFRSAERLEANNE